MGVPYVLFVPWRIRLPLGVCYKAITKVVEIWRRRAGKDLS